MFEDIQSFFSTRPKRPTSSLGAGASAEDDPAMPAFQKVWKDGALVEDMFGPSPFTLHGSVGRSGADNFRPDVAKVETFLGDAGYYKPLTGDGPNGWHNANLDQAIRSFQKDKGLEVDGFLKPNGPTIGKIGSLLGGGEAQPQETEKPNDPWAMKVGGRDPGGPNTLKPPAWWQAIGDGNGDSGDPKPFAGQPRLPSPVPAGGEPVPPAGFGVSNYVEHRPTQEQMDRYQADYRKWVQDNWDAIQKNQELKRQGLPTIPLSPPPHDPREGIPGVLYAVDPAGAKSSPAGKSDPLPNHTINREGIDANQGYAEMLVRDSDPGQTARTLKRAIDDYGDQGRGDVADLLARFQKIDGAKAEALRRELHKASGEMLPYRLAPLGEGFREPTEEEKIAAAPKAPFGSAQGADRWAAGNMAEVLLGRGNYADAITHFRGEIGRNRSEAMPYLAAVHEIMGEKNPAQATSFATQMQKAGLAAVPEKKVEVTPQPLSASTPVPTPEPAKPEQASTQTTTPPLADPAQPVPGSPPGGAGSDGGKTGSQSDTKSIPKPPSTQPEGNEAQGGGAGSSRPVVNKGNERIKMILENKPAKFEIKDNPKEDGSAPIWRLDSKGKEAVEKYGKIAEDEARRQGVDPNLVKSIMYYENADGHKFGLNDAADTLGVSGSVMPMNMNPKIWGGLGIDRTSASQPENNIRAAVTLIKRIQERVDDPTPEKIGSLWNGIMLDQVNQRGARIGRIAKERPWEKGSRN